MRLLRDRLGEKVAIEAWEAGVAWPGDRYDQEVHADETLKLLATLLLQGVRRVVYLPVSFSPGRGRAEEFVRPLVRHEDGVPNAAGDAYAALVAATQGAKKWAPVTRRGSSGVAFDLGETTVLVTWNSKTKPTVATVERRFNDVVSG
jgi:hypothetical protein